MFTLFDEVTSIFNCSVAVTANLSWLLNVINRKSCTNILFNHHYLASLFQTTFQLYSNVCMHTILPNTITHSYIGGWTFSLLLLMMRFPHNIQSIVVWWYHVLCSSRYFRSFFWFCFNAIHKRAAKRNGRKCKIQLQFIFVHHSHWFLFILFSNFVCKCFFFFLVAWAPVYYKYYLEKRNANYRRIT